MAVAVGSWTAAEHENRGDHPRLREGQFDACESGSCPKRHHQHEGRRHPESRGRLAGCQEGRPHPRAHHGQEVVRTGQRMQKAGLDVAGMGNGGAGNGQKQK